MGRFINVLCLLTVVRLHVGRVSCSTASSNLYPPGTPDELPEVHGNKFYYFGFGSNMLSQRIHLQNPTAVRVGPALLDDYRLDFAELQQRWKGAVATIVPTLAAQTWGTLWEIELSSLPDIDDQEGVHLGIYVPLTVRVELPNGSRVPARAYHLVKQPATNLHDMTPDQVPEARQPSKTYLQCLVKGAVESAVPAEYVQRLRSLKHNGRVAKEFEEKLGLKDVALEEVVTQKLPQTDKWE